MTSTRSGGVSVAPYASFNLAAHVGDQASHVAQNRASLQHVLALPEAPRWLDQVHGTKTIDAGAITVRKPASADALFTGQTRTVCAIMTADCLPIVIWDDAARELAVIHAGWKGLFDNIIDVACGFFSAPKKFLNAWIGPSISAQAYVVDPAYRTRFIELDARFANAFEESKGAIHADLKRIAGYRLRDCGIERIDAYAGCCFAEAQRFFSYRRDGITGRFATLAWFDDSS